MKMGPDTLFTVVGEQGNWANVRLRTGETGWAAKAYIGCCVAARRSALRADPERRIVGRSQIFVFRHRLAAGPSSCIDY